jgi:hypothetical protein
MKNSTALIGCFVTCLFLVFSAGTQAGTKRFNEPRLEHGKLDPAPRLDWCLEWGKQCGKPAADYFCRKRGYQQAGQFKIAEDIGLSKLLKTGQLCKEPYCDGFSYIVCERPSKRFHKPTLEHGKINMRLPLDWCLDWGKNCGKPAADYFCRKKGFHQATRFEIAKDLGMSKLLKTGRVCSAPTCDGFAYIECD